MVIGVHKKPRASATLVGVDKRDSSPSYSVAKRIVDRCG